MGTGNDVTHNPLDEHFLNLVIMREWIVKTNLNIFSGDNDS